MGILDFVRQGTQEMLIQRPDEQKSLLIYKHPENTIPNWAQLTVDADEAAVFFRDGSLVGTLRTAGVSQRHTLSSQNIPFLGRLVDNMTGGNIFVTDLYFVTMKPFYDVRFGGTLGSLADPQLGEMVTPRIFGNMALQIVDPERFIVSYVGMQGSMSNEQVTKWITDLFLNSVKTVVGELMVQQQLSFLELMPQQNQLAQLLMSRCPDFENIGVRLVQVGAFDINLSEADLNKLSEAQAEMAQAQREIRIAEMKIKQAQAQAAQRQFELDQNYANDQRYVQNLAGGNFGQYAAGRAMLGAGEGMAQGGGGEGGGGGEMMAGAGMGAGFAMAGAMGQAFQPQAQAPAQPAAASAGASPMLQELEKLAGLKAQGILSDEEFAAAKAKLLGL